MIEKEEWTEVEAESPAEENKVEFEVEEDTAKVEATSDTKQKETKPEQPEELDGIETKGAQKRIRQLSFSSRTEDKKGC